MKSAVTIVFFMFATGLFAQNIEVSGKIAANTNWSGNVTISGDVTVEKGVTLTILPGTKISFLPRKDNTNSGKQADRSELTIFGTLIAEGRAGESGQILFTSAAASPQMHDWYGIIIQSRDDGSVLKHVVVEYAYDGLLCYGSSPVVENCTFQYNYYAGINATLRAKPLIRNVLMIGNGFAGINCELAASAVVENSVISQNTNGIVIYDRSNPDLGRSTVAAGQSAGGNHIFNNFEYNIYNRSQYDIYTQNNYWNTGIESEISSTIYDRNQNGQYGSVIFTPVVSLGQVAANTTNANRNAATRQRETINQPVAAAPENNTVLASNDRPQTQTRQTRPETTNNRTENANPPAENRSTPPVANNTPPVTQNPVTENRTATENTTAQPANDNGSATNANTTPTTPANTGNSTPQNTQLPPAENNSPAQNNTTNTATQPVENTANSQPAITNAPATQPQLNEPVIETFLDGGKRQYVSRVVPKYPRIYQRTGVEGMVLVEVLVGRDGSVQNFRVLRSDAEAFSESAETAIRQYRYKPGTINGNPVSYKVIERFEFRLR